MVETQTAFSSPKPRARRVRGHAAAERRLGGYGALLWLCPVASVLGPAFGEVADEYLLGCLLFGAVIALRGADRSGAIWWVLAWSMVTGAFASMLLLVEVPDIPSLTVMALAAVAIQAIALLGVAAPATIAEWPVRRLALLALEGPAALGMLTTGGRAGWEAWAPTLAVALNLSGPPLAMIARRRATK